ncbi:643_t:CDS:2, partial [Cetraspora pellucida]
MSNHIAKLQEKKYHILRLKDEYENILRNLNNRSTLLGVHISGAILTIIIGSIILWAEKNKLIGKLGSITTSSIAGLSGIITFIFSIGKTFINNTKENNQNKAIRENEFKPRDLSIPDELLKDLPDGPILEFIKFLNYLNDQIIKEKVVGLSFMILASAYMIGIAFVSVITNIDSPKIDFDTRISQLALSVIVIGLIWFFYTIGRKITENIRIEFLWLRKEYKNTIELLLCGLYIKDEPREPRDSFGRVMRPPPTYSSP